MNDENNADFVNASRPAGCENNDTAQKAYINRNISLEAKLAKIYEGSSDKPSANGLAIASLVMGILGIVTSFIMIGVIFSALGLAFAFLSRGNGRMHGLAVAGMICSITGFCLVLAIFLFGFAMDMYSYSRMQVYPVPDAYFGLGGVY